MSVNVFPPVSGGGGSVNNDFVVNMNETSNNVILLSKERTPGAYLISLSSGNTSYDIYLIDQNGTSVGYSSSGSVVALANFVTVVILGVAADEVIGFTFNGTVSDATQEGTVLGAGAYLTSAIPSDLPLANDTTNVLGGNFGESVEIYFEAGEVSTPAKQITRASSTSLIVTRPDFLDKALDPWSLRAINPGVVPPTGSNLNVLVGAIESGASPIWSTSSPLPGGNVNQPYNTTVFASDPDGQDVTYSITSGILANGLTLNTTSGLISGTPTERQSTFEITASDGAGAINPRSFDLNIAVATGGSMTTVGNYTVHLFTSSSNFEALIPLTGVEYLVIAGGGAGSTRSPNSQYQGGGGGGGAGGYVSGLAGELGSGGTAVGSPLSISAGSTAIVVGAGGVGQSNATGLNGGDSRITGYVNATGGGGGGYTFQEGNAGGSGGGGGGGRGGGSGIFGQGKNGANSSNDFAGGCGGGADGTTPFAGNGSKIASPGHTSSVLGNAVRYADGGGGGIFADNGNTAVNGDTSNSYGSGAGGRGGSGTGNNGRAGAVIIRY